MWGVLDVFSLKCRGCRPIPSRDSLTQLKLILNIFGTPRDNYDLDFIEDLRTINYIKTQHYLSVMLWTWTWTC